MRTLGSAAILGAVFAMGVAAGHLMGVTPAAAQGGDRVFELRTYTSPPGRLDDLHARFRNHTLGLFEKHGMTNIGYWVPADDPLRQNTLIYIVAHQSRDAAKKSWDGFRADADWQKVRTESEKNGAIVEKVESVFLTPVDYSKIR
jgi:hypothetical protein